LPHVTRKSMVVRSHVDGSDASRRLCSFVKKPLTLYRNWYAVLATRKYF
jgi:hypothetical protein